MNRKKLILTYVLQALAVVAFFIMLMPIINVHGLTMTPFELVLQHGQWVFMEEYLFGIAGLITTICVPLLLISTELYKLSATGVIKNKIFDIVVYIINIVLAVLVLGVSVNYFLGLGRTVGMSGLKLFQGPTMFEFATAFFYLHVALSVAMLVVAILNRKGKTRK